MGHQSYVLLCTETALSNPPVVQPKSSCDVHLLRSPCIIVLELLRVTVYLYLWFAGAFLQVKFDYAASLAGAQIERQLINITKYRRFIGLLLVNPM